MTFDLFGTTAAAKRPIKTTKQELAAAHWQQLPSVRRQLMRDERTPDYGDHDDLCVYFSCELFLEDNRIGVEWVYDYWHSERGGAACNGVDYAGKDVLKAQKEVRKVLEHWIDRWTDSAEEDARLADEEEEEDDE